MTPEAFNYELTKQLSDPQFQIAIDNAACQTGNFSLDEKLLDKPASWSVNKQPVLLRDYIGNRAPHIAKSLNILYTPSSEYIRELSELSPEALREFFLYTTTPSDKIVHTCEFGPITSNDEINDLLNYTERARDLIIVGVFHTQMIYTGIEIGNLVGFHQGKNDLDWIRSIP